MHPSPSVRSQSICSQTRLTARATSGRPTTSKTGCASTPRLQRAYRRPARGQRHVTASRTQSCARTCRSTRSTWLKGCQARHAQAHRLQRPALCPGGKHAHHCRVAARQRSPHAGCERQRRQQQRGVRQRRQQGHGGGGQEVGSRANDGVPPGLPALAKACSLGTLPSGLLGCVCFPPFFPSPLGCVYLQPIFHSPCCLCRLPSWTPLLLRTHARCCTHPSWYQVQCLSMPVRFLATHRALRVLHGPGCWFWWCTVLRTPHTAPCSNVPRLRAGLAVAGAHDTYAAEHHHLAHGARVPA